MMTELPIGEHVRIDIDTINDRVNLIRGRSLPDIARLFKAVTMREQMVLKYRPGSAKAMVYTKHHGVELHLGRVEELIASLIAVYCSMANRKVPRDTWRIPLRIDRLLAEKNYQVHLAAEEGAKVR